MNFFKKIWYFIVSLRDNAHNTTTYTPIYKLSNILQDENDLYIVNIQIINTNADFTMNPEEILADDCLVDKFSPRDIRALTYLGYTGKNTPQYKILAQTIMDHGASSFIIKKVKGNDIITVTNQELKEYKYKNIIEKMSPTDAHIVGYTQAQEYVNPQSNKDTNNEH